MARKKKNHPKIKKLKEKIKQAKKNFHPRDIPYAKLLPLKKTMIKALDKKNISHSSEISDIAKKFMTTVVKKQHFAEVRHGFNPEGGGIENEFNIVEEVAEGIVKAILNFIKGLRDKKKAGEPLPPDDKEIVDDAETEVEENAKEADDDEDSDSDSWFAKILDKIFPARKNHK